MLKKPCCDISYYWNRLFLCWWSGGISTYKVVPSTFYWMWNVFQWKQHLSSKANSQQVHKVQYTFCETQQLTVTTSHDSADIWSVHLGCQSVTQNSLLLFVHWQLNWVVYFFATSFKVTQSCTRTLSFPLFNIEDQCRNDMSLQSHPYPVLVHSVGRAMLGHRMFNPHDHCNCKRRVILTVTIFLTVLMADAFSIVSQVNWNCQEQESGFWFTDWQQRYLKKKNYVRKMHKKSKLWKQAD